MDISAFAFDSSGYLFAGTSGGSLFRTTQSTTSIREERRLPETFALHQNFPNPFNPTTTIQYALPTGSLVSLQVFDILGREVATLVNEFKNAGEHQVQFNASGLGSGVFFYRLQAGRFIETKRMMLVK
jgi:hypothetical protein